MPMDGRKNILCQFSSARYSESPHASQRNYWLNCKKYIHVHKMRFVMALLGIIKYLCVLVIEINRMEIITIAFSL